MLGFTGLLLACWAPQLVWLASSSGSLVISNKLKRELDSLEKHNNELLASTQAQPRRELVVIFLLALSRGAALPNVGSGSSYLKWDESVCSFWVGRVVPNIKRIYASGMDLSHRDLQPNINENRIDISHPTSSHEPNICYVLYMQLYARQYMHVFTLIITRHYSELELY